MIDPAANQRTLAAAKSVSELFFENGIAVNTSVNKDLFSGISRVRRLFAERPPAIYVFSDCPMMIKELKGYWWGNGDTPVKRNDHAMDELRYFIMSRPENKPRGKELSKTALYKERLLRLRRATKH